MGNPQALNRYAYVLNNPLRYTDPTGHRIPIYEENRRGHESGDNVYYHPQTGQYSYDRSPQVRWAGLDGQTSAAEAIVAGRDPGDWFPQARGTYASYSGYVGSGEWFAGGSIDLVWVEADEGPQLGIFFTQYGKGAVTPNAAVGKAKGVMVFDQKANGKQVDVDLDLYAGRAVHGTAGASLFQVDMAEGRTAEGKKSGLTTVDVGAGPSLFPANVGEYDTYSHLTPLWWKASNEDRLGSGLLRMLAAVLTW